MKAKRIEYAREILIQQMNHWILFPLLVTVEWLSRNLSGVQKPGLLLWGLCSFFPLLFFIFRRRVERISLFILLHIAAAGLVLGLFCMKFSFRSGVCAAAAILYAVFSLGMQIRGSLYTDPIPLPLGVAAAMCALLLKQRYPGAEDWNAYYAFALIGVVALYCVITYLQQYLEFLSVNQSSAGYLPASEMFRSGFSLVLGYTLFGSALLWAGAQVTFLSEVLRYVRNLLLWILRLLLSGLPEGTGEEAEEITGQGFRSPMEGLPPAGETFWLWKVLEKIAGLLLLALVAYGVFRLLMELYRWLRDYIVTHGRGEELQTGCVCDVRERCGIERGRGKKSESVAGFLSPGGRVRRLYKRKVASAAMRLPEQERLRPDCSTAREWEEKTGAEGMAALYEKARYSDSEVTGADVRRMREICR